MWQGCADIQIIKPQPPTPVPATLPPTPAPPAPWSVQVDFTPADVIPPAGWLADSGAVYGPRNGHTYGWDRDLTKDTRDRGGATLDSTLIAPCVSAKGCSPAPTWRLAVPDGRYSVTVVFCDEGYGGGTDGCLLQGTAAGVGNLAKGEEKAFVWCGNVSGAVEFSGSWHGGHGGSTECTSVSRIKVVAADTCGPPYTLSLAYEHDGFRG